MLGVRFTESVGLSLSEFTGEGTFKAYNVFVDGADGGAVGECDGGNDFIVS